MVCRSHRAEHPAGSIRSWCVAFRGRCFPYLPEFRPQWPPLLCAQRPVLTQNLHTQVQLFCCHTTELSGCPSRRKRSPDVCAAWNRLCLKKAPDVQPVCKKVGALSKMYTKTECDDLQKSWAQMFIFNRTHQIFKIINYNVCLEKFKYFWIWWQQHTK